METKDVTCIVKKKVVEYWVAVTPDGREVEIKGTDDRIQLKDGMELTGTLHEEQVQDTYEDGSFARSFHVDEWLQVGSNKR